MSRTIPMRPLALPSSLGVGAGLRPTHYHDVLNTKHSIPWFEVISENFMGIEGGPGGRPIALLEAVRARFPVALHGVSLSIGSTDPLNFKYLEKLKTLKTRIEPIFISDHLCWTSVGGENLHDLLPLPYTEEALSHVVERVKRVQDFLGCQILLENVSSYLTFNHSEISEWEFLSEVAKQADCLLLLDINNIYVSSINHRFDPSLYLRGIPKSKVAQMHLAGYTEVETESGSFLIDTHDAKVTPPVWKLYQAAVRRFGSVPALVEWDAKIPDFKTLEAEVEQAQHYLRNTTGPRLAAVTQMLDHSNHPPSSLTHGNRAQSR